MQVNIKTHPVEILTGYYQISGNMEVRGNPGVFVNDASFSTYNVHDAVLTPLTIGSAAGAIKHPLLYIPKSEPQVMLIGEFAASDAQLLAHRIRMVCFTDTYIIRAFFHTGPETAAQDLFFAQPGPLFGATDAEIVPMRPLAADLGGQADLVYVHKSAVRTFYAE
jgi:hypothetical protein